MTSSARAGTDLPIRENVPLKPYTTFKIGGPARYFVEVRSPNEVRQATLFAQQHRLGLFVLGGGSNVLVSDRGFHGVVLHPANRGLDTAAHGTENVRLTAEAAENWDEVVAHAVHRGWWGIENLSHIPGQAGAALVQNIGAYGQQLSEVFESAEVVDLRTGRTRSLDAASCRLAYRRSIFNSTHRNRYLILRLSLRLSKRERPRLEYRDVGVWFRERGIARPSQGHIREAIIQIRDRKFPFPREERGGNAGSFFKNLVLSEAEYAELESRFQREFPPGDFARLREFRDRAEPGNGIKIPTAFLIGVCGLKGRRIGGAEVNASQPLVLLNRGGATADDVMSLAKQIRRTLYARLGVTANLEPEPVGFTPAELKDYLAVA